ncbi:hypothetical protein predicted by Glimmer/Critica (plasmid) [Acetobacter ghanensis]|uniref:Uncharacterized protein n=1 Tax=Acetobacter ghanensis TaxID=431306 RepID=A0A0U5FAB8_9PROT|nr:hypothetical protein predicted by Glimmer/Critica [Acetobacter ghanensis]
MTASIFLPLLGKWADRMLSAAIEEFGGDPDHESL